MMHSELGGVVVPIIVPLDERDRVDAPAFRKHIRFLAERGVHGLFVGGSAGEGPLLTNHEWTRMMEIAIDEAGDRLSLLGGVMDTSTARVVERIRLLQDIGYRHVVVTPTYYITPKTPDEHVRLFEACKQTHPDMEMIAYNIPAAVGSAISLETFLTLGRRGLIRYCKESSENLPFFMELVTAGQELGLEVLMGNEVNIADALRAGAIGMVPVCANVEPETFVGAYDAAARHDDAALQRAQDRINFLRESLVLAGSCWLAGPKYALCRMGLGTGKLVSPLQPLSAAEQRRVDERLGLGHDASQ